jgi:hypothetical protein
MSISSRFSGAFSYIGSNWKKALAASGIAFVTLGLNYLYEGVYAYFLPELNGTSEIIKNQESKFSDLQVKIDNLAQQGKISPEEMVKINSLFTSIKEDTSRISSITKSVLESQEKGYCSNAASGGVVVKEGGAYKFSSDITAGIKRFDADGQAVIGFSGGGKSGSETLDPGEGSSSFISDGKECRVVYLGTDDKQTGALTVSCAKKPS